MEPPGTSDSRPPHPPSLVWNCPAPASFGIVQTMKLRPPEGQGVAVARAKD